MEWTLKSRNRELPPLKVVEYRWDRTKNYPFYPYRTTETFSDNYFIASNDEGHVSETDFSAFVSSNPRPTQFLPCDHLKWTQSYGSSYWYTVNKYNRRYKYNSIAPNHANTAPHTFFNAKYAVVGQDHWETALDSAITKVKPSIERYVKTINLYTFILELAEILTIIPGILKSLTRGALDRGVDTYIGTNFMVLPFISDMEAFHDIFTRLDDVIDRWNEAARAGSLHNEHATILNTQQSGELPYYLTAGLYYPEKTYTYNEVAKIHLYYVPELISDDMRSKAWLKAFGLDELFKGIWDGVPFSWAIDYFTNIGEMIESFDQRIPNMFRFKFVDAGYSQKISADYVITGPRAISSSYTPWRGPPVSVTGTWDRFKRTQLSTGVFADRIRSIEDFSIDLDINTRQASYLVGVGRILTRKG